MQLSEKVTAKLGSVVAFSVFVFFFLYSFDAFHRMGIDLNNLQSAAIGLFLIFFMVFIYCPLRKSKVPRTLPWYDIIFILLALTFSGYLVVRYNDYWLRMGQAQSSLEIALGIIAIICVLEVVRRTTGTIMLAVVGVFLLYAIFGDFAPGFFKTPGVSLGEMSGQMWLGGYGIYSVPVMVLLDYIFPFLLFSTCLVSVGGAEFFRRIAFTLFARFRGGAGKIAIVLNYFLGMVNGSTIANCYMSGPICLPRMKEEGFKDNYAGGLISTAANGAALAPPVMSFVAFLMAEFIGISYIQVCFAAAIPAFLYFLSLFLLTDLDAAKAGLRPSPMLEEERIPLTKAILDGWHIIVVLIILIWLLAGMFTTVRLAVIMASALLLLLGSLRKKTRVFREMPSIVERTAGGLIAIGPISAGAGLIIGCLGLTSLDYKFSFELISFAGGNMLLVLLFAALACFVLGMGMPGVAAYIIVALIITPPLVTLGLPLIVIHMFVFYFSLTSMVTPPVCLNVYVVAPMVKSSIMRVGLSGTRLGIATYIIPFLFVFYPALLLVGKPLDVVFSLFICIIATVGLCFGMSRYGLVNASWLEAITALVGAALLIVPFGLWYKFVGGGLIATVLVAQIVKWRKGRAVVSKNKGYL